MNFIKCLVVFVMAMMLFAANAAATTTISKVLIRDCSRGTDTSIVVTSGNPVNPASLPASWSLDFILTRTADVKFTTDGGTQYEYESVPYCPVGHNTPLKLAQGTHKITVQINDGTRTTFILVLGAPSAVAASEDPCVFGSNGEGITYPSCDPSLHPQLISACKAYQFQYFRLWTDEAFSTPFPSTYWKIPLKYQAAGIRVLAVVNFQQSPGYRAPSDKDWLTKINSFPAATASGVWGVCLGNEVDLTTYYTGTVVQLAHLMQLAYPILHAKGYVVISPSTLRNLTILKQLNAMGVLNYCDYIDYHVYEASASTALSEVDTFKAYANSIDKPSLMSEIGIRGSAGNLTAWGQQVQAFFGGLQTRSGIYLQFPLFWLTSSSDPLCQMAPLSRTYGENAPFTGIWNTISK